MIRRKGGLRRLSAALAIVAPTTWSTPGSTQRVEHLAATDVFALADQARATGHVEQAATLYDALARDPDSQVRAEARFRKGTMLADAHRYKEAALAFRAVLDEQPGAAGVRLELARVLALLGDEVAARRELRQARAAGLPPDVAITVSQFARALRDPRRLGGSLEIALAPDSNVNRATQQRTLDTIIAPLTLSRDARAKSGIGAKASGSGFARVALTDHLSLLPRASVLANLYRAGEFDDVSASGLLGLEWRSGADRLNPSAGVTRRWYGGNRYADTRTVTLGILHPAGSQAQWLLGASASDARYRQNELQDGGLFSFSVGYERAFSARSGLSATATATRQTARDAGYATLSGGASAVGYREAGGTTVFASLGLHRLQSDRALFLFPDRRREWLIDVSAGATVRRLAVRGFAPVVRLAYERNISTVGLYDYARVSSDFGVTRAF